MEFLPKGFTLEICTGGFPLGTDSMVLAHYAKLPKNARVLDLGSGCGTLGLLLCAKDDCCRVTGIEIEDSSHRTALDNIRRNGLQERLESICADGAQVPGLLPPGDYSVCISNPPYYSGGPASRSHPGARREDTLPPEVLMHSASWALKFGGDFFLVHKPERLGQLIAAGAREGLEAKRLLLLRHRENGPVNLIFLQLRKGAKPGLVLEEAALYTVDGNPTRFFREIYHTEE